MIFIKYLYINLFFIKISIVKPLNLLFYKNFFLHNWYKYLFKFKLLFFKNYKYILIYKNTVFFNNFISKKTFNKKFFINKKYKNIFNLVLPNKYLNFLNNNNTPLQYKFFCLKFNKKIFFILPKHFFFIKTFNILYTYKFYKYINTKILISYKNFKKEKKITQKEKKGFNYFKYYSIKNSYYNNYYFDKKYLIYDENSFTFTKYFQQIILNFLEGFFKKKFFIKNSSNHIKSLSTNQLLSFVNENKHMGYSFSKYFDTKEFIEIVWYSFRFRDLNMLAVWISKQMEKMSFKNHRKFIMFIQNFFLKNVIVFTGILCINGFFFDIRGKVGVTGSSKKRHNSFKIGILNRSDKKNKLEVNQKLVRTYSGVLGLTYIMSY